MEGIKLYREKDVIVNCKECKAEVSIGFNILQEEAFEKFKDEAIKESLCPKCLMRHRINSVVDYDSILLETARNMIAVGVI
jgi:hypothetical protein